MTVENVIADTILGVEMLLLITSQVLKILFNYL